MKRETKLADAELLTNNDKKSLALRDLKEFDDGSGGTCQLELKSDAFSAALPFTFDDPPVWRFVSQLEVLEETLQGAARLGRKHEDEHILLTGDGLGHINVTGVLRVYGGHPQRLEFAFGTDQTALGQFIRSIRLVIRPAKERKAAPQANGR
jgi:hypothetical protein